MDTNKLVAIAGSFLIASGGIAGVRAWANASASATLRGPAAEVDAIQTLPEVVVRPTPQQLRALRPRASRTAAPVASAPGGGSVLDMPYYSFAVQPTQASRS